MKIGLSGILFVLFITLKLTGYIDWSWWWVASPLWIPAVIGLICFFIYFLVKAVEEFKK